MVVQTATVIPLGIGGWGPREGVAAWAFAAAGLGAATGIKVTTLYAVLMLIAVAPGLACCWRTPVAAVTARDTLANRDDPIWAAARGHSLLTGRAR